MASTCSNQATCCGSSVSPDSNSRDGGVDLLAYRATQADPLDLVRAARGALAGGRLIVAGSVKSGGQIRALAEAGADAFTIGSAALDGSFSPAKGSFRGQILDIIEACDKASSLAA